MNYTLFDVLKNKVYEEDQIIIIKGISKSKAQKKADYVRSFIKIVDDAHFNGIHPKSDFIFIDYASFLEKNWVYIGAYVVCNTLQQDFDYLPMLVNQPLKIVK